MDPRDGDTSVGSGRGELGCADYPTWATPRLLAQSCFPPPPPPPFLLFFSFSLFYSLFIFKF
jgi:hypothetical protein